MQIRRLLKVPKIGPLRGDEQGDIKPVPPHGSDALMPLSAPEVGCAGYLGLDGRMKPRPRKIGF